LRLTLLGYAQSRPHLRVLRLPDEDVVPSPVGLNRPVALDRAVVRDGWVAFDPDHEVWGVALPLAGKAFKVGEWWQCLPAPNPRTVWLARPYEGDPALAVEYDGVARAEVGRAELAPGTLAAVVPEGFVLGPEDWSPDSVDTLTLDGEPLAPGWQVVARSGSLLAVAHRDGALSLVDVATRSVTAVEKPLAGEWNAHAASFSPDGSTLALGVAHEDRSAKLAGALPAGFDLTSIEDMMERLVSEPPSEEVMAALESPSWHQLALVEAATGAVTLADGRFDNFNSTPVWSADGRRLVFDAPFDKSLFVCDVAERRLLPVLRRRGRVSPLVDLTAFAGA
jgi:hypothetical protein